MSPLVDTRNVRHERSADIRFCPVFTVNYSRDKVLCLFICETTVKAKLIPRELNRLTRFEKAAF
jgi:hypothetical protein